MTETPQPTPAPTPPPAPPEPKPYWVYRLAAWVAIVAGIVFIVSTIFLAGFYASGGKGAHRCHHKHHGPHHGAMFDKGGFHKGFHMGPHWGPAPMVPPVPEGAGPGEPPPSVTKPPAPAPGR